MIVEFFVDVNFLFFSLSKKIISQPFNSEFPVPLSACQLFRNSKPSRHTNIRSLFLILYFNGDMTAAWGEATLQRYSTPDIEWSKVYLYLCTQKIHIYGWCQRGTLPQVLPSFFGSSHGCSRPWLKATFPLSIMLASWLRTRLQPHRHYRERPVVSTNPNPINTPMLYFPFQPGSGLF